MHVYLNQNFLIKMDILIAVETKPINEAKYGFSIFNFNCNICIYILSNELRIKIQYILYDTKTVKLILYDITGNLSGI